MDMSVWSMEGDPIKHSGRRDADDHRRDPSLLHTELLLILIGWTMWTVRAIGFPYVWKAELSRSTEKARLKVCFMKCIECCAELNLGVERSIKKGKSIRFYRPKAFSVSHDILSCRERALVESSLQFCSASQVRL